MRIMLDLPEDIARSLAESGQGTIDVLRNAARTRHQIQLLISVARASRRLYCLYVTSTLGVLAEAHRAQLLDFEAAVMRLRQTSFYLSENLIARVRQGI